MTNIKHVLILIILIFPLFMIAPTMVIRENESQTILKQVDNSTPAQFAKETLRVAVYAESDTTLPSYAEGGEYASYYANVIAMLEDQDYAVTALTTQNILENKLMAASYDVFVLPDQLPRDEIIYLVKDYWLAGGGILSFDGSIGYLLYMGMIHPDLEGDFGLVGYEPGPDYWYNMPYVDNIIVTERFPVTKTYQVDDILVYNENATVFNLDAFISLIGNSFHLLARDADSGENGAIGAFDNPDRGGRIVQIPGNCSSFTSWQTQITVDAIDWLAPRPKARIAFDFSKLPYYGVDEWDLNVTNVPRYNVWRDFMVNHSYTVDKLYPPVDRTLSASDIAPFDVLIINLPQYNYSASEMTDVIRPFVANGGGLFYLTDYNGINVLGHANMNDLIAPWGFNITDDHPQMGSFSTSEFDDHPTLEDISSIYMAGGEWVNVTGEAYSIIKQGVYTAVGGCELGYGRVIVSGDINFLDHNNIDNDDNAIFAVNVINWLSAGTADVLVYTDGDHLIDSDFNYYRSAIANALNGLGISFFMTNHINYFNLNLATGNWNLVIYDANSQSQSNYTLLTQHLEAGGKLIMRDFRFRYTGVPLWNYIGWESKTTMITSGPPTVHLWSPVHPIFNLPVDYAASNISSSSDYFNTDFTHVMLFSNATALAGITLTPEENMSAIVLGANGQAICNMFAISEYDEDTDDSTYADNFEIMTNEIGFLYFDRPTIDHPADVSYMETETGNEITWNPTAPAGAWSYVLRVNGTIDVSGKWTGSAMNINVDGVNKSITEYQLTVYDRLGYSVSDVVILNVTEYIPTTTGEGGPPIDPMLLAIIGVGVAVVLVIIIVVHHGKKK